MNLRINGLTLSILLLLSTTVFGESFTRDYIAREHCLPYSWEFIHKGIDGVPDDDCRQVYVLGAQLYDYYTNTTTGLKYLNSDWGIDGQLNRLSIQAFVLGMWASREQDVVRDLEDSYLRGGSDGTHDR